MPDASTPAKAVIFDVGGVLIHMDWRAYDRFGVERGLPEREWLRILHQTDEYDAWQTGRGTAAEWRASIVRELRAHIGDRAEAFLEAWSAQPTPRHEPNIEMAQALIDAGYTVAVLSNAGPDLRDRIDETLGRSVAWHEIICSAEVGLAKPDPAIYRLVMQRLSLRPEQCFFIDDIRANVAAAQEVGWTAHRFKGDYAALQADLRDHGYEW